MSNEAPCMERWRADAPGTPEVLWLAPGALKINTSLATQLGLTDSQAKTRSLEMPRVSTAMEE